MFDLECFYTTTFYTRKQKRFFSAIVDVCVLILILILDLLVSITFKYDDP